MLISCKTTQRLLGAKVSADSVVESLPLVPFELLLPYA